MKMKDRFIDLSDIKDDEMDKTASFTDLMSRSERKRRNKEKLNIESSNDEIDTTLDINNNLNIDNTLDINNNRDNDTLDINNELVIDNKEILDNNKIDTKKNIFKREIEYNNDFDIEEEKPFNTGLIITNGLFLLISTCIFLYSCIFTNNLDKDKFLMIDSISLASMYFIFGLSIITGKGFSKFLSILNYLIFIAFTILNVLITLNYIK